MNKQSNSPPKWANKLLNYFCREDYADEILGDLHEAFYWRLKKKGIRKAKTKFIWEVTKSLHPRNLKSIHHFSLNTMIFRNYIKIAFRSLLRRKSTSFTNIFGLSLGATSFVFIFLYSYQIISFDDNHQKKDQIFLAYKERVTPDGIQPAYDTWVPMKNRLKDDYAQVIESALFYQTDSRIVQNNQFLEEEITYTNQSFFNIFSFPVLHGNEEQLFANRSSVVISKELAIKYFQREDPVGESMEIFIPNEDTTINFQVSAILAPFPNNTSLQPHLIIQPESLSVFIEIANEWSGSFLETFVLLDQKESASTLEEAFPDLIETIWGAETRANTNFKLLPFNEYYDTFQGSKSDATTLLYIGIGILLIAIINFMNLSTAQASRRIKEIGLRKVLGAFKGQLRTQFITEAFIATLFAMVLTIGLVAIILPYFNNFFDVSISLSQFSLLEIITFCTLLSVSVGMLSGSYPAIYLSSINAMDAMRQKMGFGGSVNFRNVLVVLQFSIALFLIASSFFIRNQILHMTQSDMGFESEGIVAINASRSDFVDREEGLTRLNILKNLLKSKSYVQEVTMSRSIPSDWTRSFMFAYPEGWTGDPLRMRATYLDANFFNTYDIPLKYGDYFLDDTQGDQRTSAILNEAAMKAFQFDPAKQNVITNRSGERRINVVGVVEDFNFETLQNEVAPTIMFHRVATNPVHRFISCKMDMSNLPAKMEEIEALWNALGSTNAFSYSFIDENVEQLYASEKRYLGLVTMFSTLSIVVACLGLYGLALFIIEKRRKEISIRKVLGSEISGILGLIFKDFTKWVAIAFVLSVPFVVYFINDWLAEFHNRISVGWITFAVTFGLVLGLVILTVGYQSLKAALSNPVKYLKDE